MKIISDILNRERSPRTIHFIHRTDETNCGDMASCPLGYFPYFNKYKICKHDIYDVKFKKIKRDDVVIFGGGGLFDCLEEWNQNINRTLDICDNCFAWSVGFNTHHGTSVETKINFEKFKKITVRDFGHPSHFDFCPCVSCMVDFPNAELCRKVGVLEHKSFKLDLPYPTINNSADIQTVLKFIAESSVIITDTYHVWYWSTLMGKRVILMKPFSTKFDYLPYPPAMYSGDLEHDIKCAKVYPNARRDAVRLNKKFFEYIKKYLDGIQ